MGVISASVIAIGVALAPAAIGAHHSHHPRTAGKTALLQADGLEFLGQLAAGNVRPDMALRSSWIDDVTAVAHSLGLSDRQLAVQLSEGRSLAQIARSRGVPTATPTRVLLRHIRGDMNRAEHDKAISPTAAGALLNALSAVLGKS